MNYADLQQLVEDHLARSDLSSWFQSFVASAETWLNYGSQETPPLRVREMETIATLTPVSGVVTLPADYLEYERVSEALSTRRTLDYVTPDQAERWYPDGAAGLAEQFTIIGESLYTFPLAQSDISLLYYRSIPPLTPVDDTNWLLTKNQNIYLHAVLFAAYTFTKDADLAAAHAGLASALIAGMNQSGVMAKYSRAGVKMRGPTP